MKGVLNAFEKNPGIPLSKIEEDQKDEYGIILFTIMLFFHFNFNKEGIQEFLNNKNEDVKKYIFQGLINKDFYPLFKNI